MKAIDDLRKHINGPKGDRCRGFTLRAKTRIWCRQIERACIATECTYTMGVDPEDGHTMFFITGTREQLKALVTILDEAAS